MSMGPPRNGSIANRMDRKRHYSPPAKKEFRSDEEGGWAALVMAARFGNARLQVSLEKDGRIGDQPGVKVSKRGQTRSMPSRRREQHGAVGTGTGRASHRGLPALVPVQSLITRHHGAVMLSVSAATGGQRCVGVRLRQRQTDRRQQEPDQRNGRRSRHNLNLLSAHVLSAGLLSQQGT